MCIFVKKLEKNREFILVKEEEVLAVSGFIWHIVFGGVNFSLSIIFIFIKK